MAAASVDLSGLLIVDKPGRDLAQPAARLYTSHDVVARVRRWSGQRRIGHTGTLDPMASGVLVLCLGQATRLVEYYQGHDKRYTATIALGTATDSYDAEGAVTTSAPVPPLDAATIEAALHQFRGSIVQTPPVFSALKQGGEALYAKARRGEMVTVAARPVTIHRLVLVEWTATHITLDVACSAGTYIRTLAHDLGLALGTVAHLAALRRTAAGGFTSEDAHTLDAIEAAAAEVRLADLLLPLGAGLDLPPICVDAPTAQRLGHGQRVVLPPDGGGNAQPPLAVAVDAAGTCLGIVERVDATDAADGPVVWKAAKWLAGQA